MKMNFVYTFTIFGLCVYGVQLLENDNEEDPYNQVRIEPIAYDPCEDWELDVPNYTKPGRRVSEVKCLEYIWRIMYFRSKQINEMECEFKKYGVKGLIGGTSALHGEFPHMGAIGWKAKVGTWIFKCGGSLISENFVLTAAHCASVATNDLTVAELEPKIVRLGSKSILDFFRGSVARDFEILRFIRHPRYNSMRQYYDIALVELVEEVTFHWRVYPACLWNAFENPETGILTGWGVVEVGTLKTSPELQRADIKIVDSSDCDEKLKMRRNRKWQGIVRHQLCAADNMGRIDTCQGDSGGPLQSMIPLKQVLYRIVPWNIYKIVGVTSFGFGCGRANAPSIYTRVASFVGWIENIVWSTTRNTTSPRAVEDRFYFST